MFKYKLALSLASALTFSGCSKGPASDVIITSQSTPEVKKITSAGVVNAQPQRAEIAAGESGEAVVRLVIQNGYHVNANPPTFPYLIATELEIKPSEGVKVGKVTYPPPVTGTFAFSEEPLAVYEGTTELKAELKADKATSKGNRSLAAILRIQACDDQVCYPPGTVDLQIPVTIK
ncbi:MAG TPA: protein-disulfide reductase DsbD domain-containing protein [Pyrinomonadaceae bacterium]|nr:protein-disulfide reductase DsbD domain-containing protein [Pyrinomonadaceae bacterium]